MALFAPDADGARLLTGDDVAGLLAAMTEDAGGRLLGWRLDHVDVVPGEATTATFVVTVAWPRGTATELIGVTARTDGPSDADADTAIFRAGVLRGRRVAAWWHPDDPELPGLPTVAVPELALDLLRRCGALDGRVTPDQVALTMLTYRPRRRAVVRVEAAGRRWYAKALRVGSDADIVHRLRLLRDAGLPVAPVVAHDPDLALVVLGDLPGRPLADALFDAADPCRAEQVVDVLDALPAAVAGLPRRDPWSAALPHYAELVARALPGERDRLAALVARVEPALAGVPAGDEPTHGDLHEHHLHVGGATAPAVVGLLDVDTLGPGRRVDDLACLVAHLASVQGMTPVQRARCDALLRRWLQVFDTRVDQVELRLRAAAVAVSLATGPHRTQRPGWEADTRSVLEAAEWLARLAG